MRVIINVSEQISPSMVEKYFRLARLQAMVTAAPKEMMHEIMRSCKMDICAYYADEVDSAKLAAFFREVSEIGEDIIRVLFIEKDNFCLINEYLENCIEECFTLPLDADDFMMRLRRMARIAAGKNVRVSIRAAGAADEKTPDDVQEFMTKLRRMTNTAGTKNTVDDAPAADAADEDITGQQQASGQADSSAPVIQNTVPPDKEPAPPVPVREQNGEPLGPADTPAFSPPPVRGAAGPAQTVIPPEHKPGAAAVPQTESPPPVIQNPVSPDKVPAPPVPVREQNGEPLGPADTPAFSPPPVRGAAGPAQTVIPPEHRPGAAAVPQADSFLPQQVFVTPQQASPAPQNTGLPPAAFQQGVPFQNPLPSRPAAPEIDDTPKGKKPRTKPPFKHLKKEELIEIISAQEQRLREANERIAQISRQIDDRRLRLTQYSYAGQADSVHRG